MPKPIPRQGPPGENSQPSTCDLIFSTGLFSFDWVLDPVAFDARGRAEAQRRSFRIERSAGDALLLYNIE